MKKFIFSKLWKHDIYYKVENVSKIKGLEGFTWIKNGVVMKEAFKD
jgi:hypothetical protein